MEHGIRVGIADDDAMTRVGLARLLARWPDMQVVGFAADGQAAIELAQTGTIQVLLLDLEMPTLTGGEALPRIRSLAPSVQVIIYAGSPASTHAAPLLAAGAAAYLQKSSAAEQIVDAIRAAAQIPLTAGIPAGN